MFPQKHISNIYGLIYARIRRTFVLGFLCFAILFVSSLGINTYTRTGTPEKVYAATSSTLNFQGRLLSSAGNLVPDGYYNLEFKLYDGGTSGGPGGAGEANAGTNLWTETYYDSNGVTAGNDNRVRIVNGYFSVNLGSQTAFPGTINWDQELWLTMNVGGSTQTATPTWDGEMLAPSNKRTKLTGVPFAFKAQTALGVSSNNTSSASTNSGNVTIQSGNATGATSNSGNITLDVGTATQTAGTISIGTANQTGLTIGRSGVTTLLQGNVSIASGGTNFGVYYRDGSGNVVTTAAGTSGECFKANTGAAPTWGSCTGTGDFIQGGNAFTANAILGTNDNFALEFETFGTTKMILQADGDFEVDANTFFVDAANNRVGIGTVTPTAQLQVSGAGGGNPLFVVTDTTATSQNVLTIADGGAATFRNQTDSTNAFQVQNSSGTTLLNVDTATNPNLITNPSFETNTTGYSAKGTGSTITRVTTQNSYGIASLQVDTTGTANAGVSYAYTFSPNTTYTVSFDIKGSGPEFSTLWVGRQDQTGTDINCTQLYLSQVWKRYACTFTTGGTISSSSIYIKDTGTNHTFYVDAVQLELASSATAFNQGGTISLGGPVTGPTAFTGPISVGNNAGPNFLEKSAISVNEYYTDTIHDDRNGLKVNLYIDAAASSSGFISGNAISVGTWGANAQDYTGAIVGQYMGVSHAGTGIVDELYGSLMYTDNYSSGDITNLYGYYQATANYGTGDIQNAYGMYIESAYEDSTGDIVNNYGIYQGYQSAGTNNYALYFAGSTNPILTINGEGQTTFRNNTDSATAFQIQNAAGTTQFVADTTNGGLTLGSTSGTGQITLGQSTATNTISIGAAAGNGNTQTINIGTSATAGSTTNVTIGSTIAGLTTLQSQGGVAITTLGTADTSTYLCRNTSNIISGCATTGTGAAFVQGGNSFGATAVLGTNDSNSLTFETNNLTQATIAVGGATTFRNTTDSTGAFQIQNANAQNLLTINTSNSYVINNGYQTLGNELQNPSFEAGPIGVIGNKGESGWYVATGNGTFNLASNNARSGLNSVNFVANSTGGGFSTFKYFEVQPGDNIYTEVYAKSSGGANGDVNICYEFVDENFANPTGNCDAGGTPGISYELRNLTQAVPAGYYYVAPYIFVDSNATTGTFYFDDLYLKRATEQAPMVFRNSANSATAFQIQNASGTQLFNIDNTADATNLITNGSFEQNTTGWTAKNGSGTSTISQTTSQKLLGTGALQVVTTGSATNAGASWSGTFTNGQQYTFSLFARSGTSFSTFEIGYSNDNSADTSCSTGQSVATTVWSRYNCTFTYTGTTGTSYVYFKQTDATNRTFYVDAVRLETGSRVNVYKESKISLNGAITSPVLIQGADNTQTALNVQQTDGTDVFNVNTTNGTVAIGSGIVASAKLRVTNLSSDSGKVALDVIQASTADNIATFKSTASNTVFTIGGTGAITARNASNSPTAFQIQDSAGTSNLFIADTTNDRIGIGKVPTQGTLDIDGNAYAGTFIGTSGVYSNTKVGLNTASQSTGYFAKNLTIGTGGVLINDVIVYDSSGTGVTTTTARDTRIYGVSTQTVAAAGTAEIAIGGNYVVNATTNGGANPIAVGDQLVTSTTAGRVMADNNATTGIIGRAASALASGTGTVNVVIDPVSGQYSPTFRNATDSTTAFRIQNSAGTTTLFNADTTNSLVTLLGGTDATLGSGGQLVLGDTASANLVLDSNEIQTRNNGVAADLYINNDGGGVYTGFSAASIFNVNNGQFSISANGDLISRNATNSTTAFRIQDASGSSLFNVDTTNGFVGTVATNSASANTRDFNLRTGNAAGATSNSGSLRLDVGTATQTAGSILIGTVNNASAITLGSTSGTGQITLGQSTATNTISIGGAAGNGNTQTINIGTSATAGSTTNVTIGSTIAGTTTLQSQGGVIVSTLGTADTATYVCRNSTNRLATCATTGTGAAFVQGGNSFGATAVLGTNDANSLTFETNNNTQLTIADGGATTFRNSTNSTTAFQIQNAAGTSLFTADTTASRISIGSNGTDIGQFYVGGQIPTSATGSVATGADPDAVVVVGKYAYVANYTAETLQIIDISNPASPAVTGTIALGAGSLPESLAVVGRYAYVAEYGTDTLQVVDISVPNNPTLVTSVSAGNEPMFVLPYGKYLYVLNFAGNSIVTFDISNPASPVSSGTFTTGVNGPRSAYQQGRYLYVANENGNNMLVLDAINPTSLASVSTETLSTDPSYVFVQGRYAYATVRQGTDGLRILDVSNPSNPAPVGALNFGSDLTQVVVQGRYAYVLDEGASLLYTIDISNPASPTSIGSVATGNSPYHFAVQGRYAYVTAAVAGQLQVFDMGGAYIQQLEVGTIDATLVTTQDISVANNSYIGGSLNVGGSTQINGNLGVAGVTTFKNSSDSTSALQIQNAAGTTTLLNADTTNGRISIGGQGTDIGQLYVGGVPLSSAFTTISGGLLSNGPDDIEVQGNYAYVSSYTESDLDVIDITDPANPVTIVSRDLTLHGTNPEAIKVSGKYAYLAMSSTNNLVVVDISNPADPVFVGSITVGAYPNHIEVDGRYAYVTGNGVAGAGNDRLYIVDISNPTNLTLVSNTAGLTDPVDAQIEGKYLYIADCTNLRVFDVSNPASPTLYSETLQTADCGLGIAIYGKYAYVADQTQSINVLNISNPADPVDVTNFFSDADIEDLVVQGRYMYGVSNQGATSRLYIYDLANPASPVALNNVVVGNSPYHLEVSGRYAYVPLLNSNQVLVYDLGGAYIQQLETGGIRSTSVSTYSLAVTNTATVAGSFSVGGATYLQGTLAVNGSANFNSISLSEGATRTISTATRSTNAIGNGLTISAGAAGSGASAFAGGTLTLQGGAAGGTGNANGGAVTIAGGAGVGSGTQGLVNLSTSAFTSASVQSFAASGAITAGNVDLYSSLPILTTASSVIVTVPDPAQSAIGRLLYISARDNSIDFTLRLNSARTPIDINMKENSTATLIWNGTDWTAAGASSSTDLQAAYNNTIASAGGAELVLNAPGGNADGLTVRNNGTTPIVGGLLEVQTSIGSNLFTVNNNATEYASNGGGETSGTSTCTSGFPANTWTTTTGGTCARYTTAGDNIATGQASVSIVTTSTNHGLSNRLSTSLTSGLTYTVSFAVRGTTNFSTLQVLYAPDGTTTGTVQCATAQTVTTGQWSRIVCNFVASGSITSSNAILIRQTDATGRTFYIDNLSVNVNASANHAADGSVDNAGAFATNWSNYQPSGTATTSYESTIIYDTAGSAQVDTTATAGIGMRNNMAITPSINTQYLVSFYIQPTSTMTGSVAVGFLPAGGTGAPSGSAACTDYNTQTATANTWTKITCLFTTPGSGISNPDLVIYQTDAPGGGRSFYVDALSITLNTNNSNNVQIGGANKGGPVTLFTLDRSNGAPIAANNEAYLGSMYYDTASGRIQCYEADGWGACGAAPDNIVNLNPEYAGAVLNGSGVGTMTADFCSNDTALEINETLCDVGEAKNYYRWTSPQATQQTYSIYVTYQLPSTFNDFASDDTVQLVARTDSTTNAAVTYQMFNSNGSSVTQCGTGETTVVTTQDVWQSVGINGNEATGSAGCNFAASSFIIFKINMKANSGANAYVSTLSFTSTGR